MKSIKNIFHKLTFSNFYLNLSLCLLLLTISCWSLFYYDTYPIAQSESGIFFYPSFIFTENLDNWSEFYMGARNSIHQSYQTFLYRFLITPESQINPFYIQFSYYMLMFYLAFLGFYKSVNLFDQKNKILNLYVSLVYIFNPVSAFFLLRFQYPYITIYYLFPLIFYLTHKAITSINTKDFLKFTLLNFSLLAFFSIIYAAMPTLFLLFFFWMFYSLAFIFYHFIQSPKSIFKIILTRFIPFFVIWLFINLYWFVPFAIELNSPNNLIRIKEVLNINENVQTFIFFSGRDSDIVSIITLLTQEFLSFLNHRWFIQYIILFFAFIPFFVIIINLFEILKKRKSYFNKFNLNYFLIISLFLTLFVFIRGSNEPFGKIIKYIFINFPIFQVLRNPYEKISLIYTFFFILIFAISFINLFNKYKYSRYILSIVLFSYVFFVSHKMFNTNLLLGPIPPFNNSQVGFKLKVPESYKNISNHINQSKNRGDLSRTLLVPTVQEGITYNWEKGYIGVDFIQNYISNNSYSFVSPDIYEDRKRLIINLPFAKDKSGLLQLFGFKNVVFRNDFDYLSRDINNPDILKENLLYQVDSSTYTTVPLKNLHLIYSEDKYNQMNFGSIINSDPQYMIPMDWSKNVYLRFNLPLTDTIPAKTFYRFTLKFKDIEQIMDLIDFRVNNNRKRVSFNDIQKNDSNCEKCYSTNFIYTEDTRPVNSFEFFTKLRDNTQYLVIDDAYISYYQKSKELNNDILLVEDYSDDKISHYQVNKELPVFLSPKEIKIVPNYMYFMNNEIDPQNISYVIETKTTSSNNLKIKTFPENLNLEESVISYNKISNTEYELEIKPKKSISGNYNTLLTFNFSADSLWKLTKVDTKFKFFNNKFLFEDKQFISNTYANTWYLENIPASGLKLKLIYQPKIYFNLVYPFSIFFFALLVVYLLYLVLKDYFNARNFK